jgi:hypothetical protein
MEGLAPKKRARELALAACLALVTLLFAGVAGAATRVVILDPGGSGALREAVTRTEAELASEGFEVLVRPHEEGEPRRVLDAAAARYGADAAIALDGAGGLAEIWVTDRLTGKTVVRTIDVRSETAAEQPRILAIRAVELLKASLVEAIDPATREQPKARELPYDVVGWLAPPAGPLEGIGVHLGVGLLTGFDGVGPAGAPVLRVSYGVSGGLTGRLSFAGPAFGAGIDGPIGTARVREELATLELGYAPAVDWAGFTPTLWLGGGAYHLHAKGELGPGFAGQSDDVWAALALAGAGIGYRPSERITLMLDAAALFTFPRVAVAMAGEPIATTGRPSLLASLGVIIRFGL